MSTLTTLLTVFGSELERFEAAKKSAVLELFPKTVTQLIDEFETVFGLEHTTDDIAIRRSRLLAKINAVGGQSVPYFYGLAAARGYNVYPSTIDPHLKIETGLYPRFRVGVSHIGDALYDGGTGASIFTWRVTGTSVESDTFLQELFNECKPAHTDISFINA